MENIFADRQERRSRRYILFEMGSTTDAMYWSDFVGVKRAAEQSGDCDSEGQDLGFDTGAYPRVISQLVHVRDEAIETFKELNENFDRKIQEKLF